MKKEKKGTKIRTMKYFTNIKTIEDLKKQYFALAKKYHSDITHGSVSFESSGDQLLLA